MKIIKCAGCSTKIFGKGTFDEVAKKEGWEKQIKNTIPRFFCPNCQEVAGNIEKAVSNFKKAKKKNEVEEKPLISEDIEKELGLDE